MHEIKTFCNYTCNKGTRNAKIILMRVFTSKTEEEVKR